MKLQRCRSGAGRTARIGAGAPASMRLAAAVAASMALHAAIVLAVHPSRAAAPPQGFVFTARLATAATHRDQPALLPEAPTSPSLPQEAPVALQPPGQLDGTAVPPADIAAQSGWAILPPRYYLASELQRPPAPLQPIEPEAPAEAGGREGTLLLRLDINERGSVDEAEVVRAEPGGLFEKSALAAFGGARFSPGILDGLAVKSRIWVEVRYGPADSGARSPRVPTGRGY